MGQTNKQTNIQTNKQTFKQTNKQTKTDVDKKTRQERQTSLNCVQICFLDVKLCISQNKGINNQTDKQKKTNRQRQI